MRQPIPDRYHGRMPNVVEVSDEDWGLWRDFVAMHRHLARELDRQLQRDAAISQADFSVLVVLSEAPDRKLRTGELAELLAWEKSRVSHQVARMESRGLLERTECDTDGRGTWVGLTNEGRRTLLGATREHAAAIRSLFFDNLHQGEKAAIAGVSARILEHINPEACDIADEKGMTGSRRPAGPRPREQRDPDELGDPHELRPRRNRARRRRRRRRRPQRPDRRRVPRCGRQERRRARAPRRLRRGRGVGARVPRRRRPAVALLVPREPAAAGRSSATSSSTSGSPAAATRRTRRSPAPTPGCSSTPVTRRRRPRRSPRSGRPRMRRPGSASTPAPSGSPARSSRP